MSPMSIEDQIAAQADIKKQILPRAKRGVTEAERYRRAYNRACGVISLMKRQTENLERELLREKNRMLIEKAENAELRKKLDAWEKLHKDARDARDEAINHLRELNIVFLEAMPRSVATLSNVVHGHYEKIIIGLLARTGH